MIAQQLAGWIAPAATMIAAVMTASNLGARVTGWGFVVFTLGSIAWSVVAITTGQSNLLWTNAFLTVVNGVGVWRWLGRQARYEDGGQAASALSAVERVPTLFPVSALTGSKLTGSDGQPIATIIDAMMRCSDSGLAYVVVSEGGMGGVGERLHAVRVSDLKFTEEGVSSNLTCDDLKELPDLNPGEWPAAVD